MDYNPEEIKNHYNEIPHGKAKSDAIRQAIEMADQNNDLPFMIYFREEICAESCFLWQYYGNDGGISRDVINNRQTSRYTFYTV